MKLAAVEAARDADAARKWRDSIDRVATQGIQSYELTRLEADAGDRVQESLVCRLLLRLLPSALMFSLYFPEQLRRKVEESRRGEAAAEAVRRQADMLAEAIEREKQRAVEEKEAIALQLDRQKYERVSSHTFFKIPKGPTSRQRLLHSCKGWPLCLRDKRSMLLFRRSLQASCQL